MNRRALLLAGASAAWFTLTGHSPYRKFHIYRKTRLIVMAANEDKRAAQIADELADFFAKTWKESQAVSGRAQTAPDLVQLLITNQLDIAVISLSEARDAREGKGRHRRTGPQPLCSMGKFGEHLLITRENLLAPIAEKILEPMTTQWQLISKPVAQSATGPFSDEISAIPLHAVALTYSKKGG